jgi:hypothetical protein
MHQTIDAIGAGLLIALFLYNQAQRRDRRRLERDNRRLMARARAQLAHDLHRVGFHN